MVTTSNGSQHRNTTGRVTSKYRTATGLILGVLSCSWRQGLKAALMLSMLSAPNLGSGRTHRRESARHHSSKLPRFALLVYSCANALHMQR